jgi:PleD family two-component response regulator
VFPNDGFCLLHRAVMSVFGWAACPVLAMGRSGSRLAERLCWGLELLAIAYPDSAVAAHVSIGVSVMYSNDQRLWQSLVVAVDQALYAARAAGRNRVVVQS